MPIGTTLEFGAESVAGKTLLDRIRGRYKLSSSRMSDQHKRWMQAEDTFLAYLPEREVDASRRVARENGKPQFTTIVIPYSYAVLMASHTYWTTVFLSRTPVMQFSGRHGEGEQQVQAVEALIDYQLQVGQMLVPLYIWLLDVGKYGVGILGTYWDEEISQIARIVDTPVLDAFGQPTGKTSRARQTSRLRGYVGNKIYNVRPADFYPDPRVPLHRFQQGEFCAIYMELGWNTIVERAAAGYYTNLELLRELSPEQNGGEGPRSTGSAAAALPDITDVSQQESDLLDTRPRALVEMYVKLIPSEWKLGSSDYPEIWVFTADASFQVLIGATPLGHIHNRFPFNVIELEPEGYSMLNRGQMDILRPLQNTMDWLLNSHFWAVRKTVNNQIIVDPSRVMMQDVLDPQQGGVWRLKPRAYGTDVRTVMTQVQMVDATKQNIADIQMMHWLAQMATGVSDQIFGMVGQGGRKTATEVRTSSTFGVTRLKTNSEFFSAMGWAPLGQQLIQNSQQFYDVDLKLRIVGDLVQAAGPQFVVVRPQDIGGFFDYVPVDGTMPVDRYAQANLWRTLFKDLQTIPQIAVEYDLGRIFAWVAQLAGLKNINQFKVQLTPDEKLIRMAEMGNVIPLGGKNAGGRTTPASRGATRSPERVAEPGQIPGMGETG